MTPMPLLALEGNVVQNGQNFKKQNEILNNLEYVVKKSYMLYQFFPTKA